MAQRRQQSTNLGAVVRYALRNLRADLSPAHVEDVTVECFRLAPELFSLERYPEYPRVDTAYYALKNLKPKGDVSGGLRDGWTLTRQGAQWLDDNEAHIRQFVRTPVTAQFDASALSDLDRVRSHKAFRDFTTGRHHRPSRQELADMLGCTVGSLPATWRARFSRLYALAKPTDPVLERFLSELEKAEPELLRGYDA